MLLKRFFPNKYRRQFVLIKTIFKHKLKLYSMMQYKCIVCKLLIVKASRSIFSNSVC